MLELKEYNCLGEALRAALERWPDETCLIESDRDREPKKFTFRQFRDAALLLASALQDSGFAATDRAAIIMTNQPKWLMSAYAVFFSGGVLVPLDYKLTAKEHLALLAHSRAKILVAEYAFWRAITQAVDFSKQQLSLVLVTDAPPGAEFSGARRWEEFQNERMAEFRARKRDDPACIVYSSGTSGRPKGCVLTHGNYLEQCSSIATVIVFEPGVCYLSILPTNHAVDFMMGFILPFVSGATVVHLRTLRPEYVRDAFARYRVTYMMVVPLILKNLQKGLQARFAELPKSERATLNFVIRLNRLLTLGRPRLWISRRLLKQIHESFGGDFRAFGVGSAFMDPETIQFFLNLGIPVANAYGLTEAGTALTVNDLRAPRTDTVGKPLPGVELRIVDPDSEGIGEVAVRSKTVMAGYLDDPELTAETIVDGWLMTGDLGRLDATGHLQLFGRKKNMIVTAEAKNVYPEDVETVFEGLPVKELCVFAANYIWPQHSMSGEQLVIILRLDADKTLTDDIRAQLAERNLRLINYKRVSGYLLHDQDFPLTASLKIKRPILADDVRKSHDRASVIPL